MAKMSRKEMAAFLAKEEKEVAEHISKRGLTGKDAKFSADVHRLTLAEIADEDGHTDIAQQYRRKIGD